MTAVSLESEDQFKQVISSKAIVDFYADWCGPCKVLAPKLLDYCTSKGITLHKVNVDNLESVAESQEIEAMPTVNIYVDGKVVDSVKGANMPAIEAAITKVWK